MISVKNDNNENEEVLKFEPHTRVNPIDICIDETNFLLKDDESINFTRKSISVENKHFILNDELFSRKIDSSISNEIKVLKEIIKTIRKEGKNTLIKINQVEKQVKDLENNSVNQLRKEIIDLESKMIILTSEMETYKEKQEVCLNCSNNLKQKNNKQNDIDSIGKKDNRSVKNESLTVKSNIKKAKGGPKSLREEIKNKKCDNFLKSEKDEFSSLTEKFVSKSFTSNNSLKDTFKQESGDELIVLKSDDESY